MIRYGNAATPAERRKKIISNLDPDIVTATGRINMKALEAKYQKENDIFTEQTDKFGKAMDAINRLSKAERAVILLYIELRNKSAVAELLGVSSTYTQREINRILTKIEQNNNNNNR